MPCCMVHSLKLQDFLFSIVSRLWGKVRQKRFLRLAREDHLLKGGVPPSVADSVEWLISLMLQAA